MKFLVAFILVLGSTSSAPAPADNIYLVVPQLFSGQKADNSSVSPLSSQAPVLYSYPFFQTREPVISTQPLRIHIAEPVAADARFATLPLLLIPQTLFSLREPSDHRVEPFITELPSSDAVPNYSAQIQLPLYPVSAVPVQLKYPIQITSPQALVTFPSAFAVHEPGQTETFPMKVGSILVPLPDTVKEVSPQSPVQVQVVLAVQAPAGQAVNINIEVKPETSSSGSVSIIPIVGVEQPVEPTTTTTTTTTITTTTAGPTTTDDGTGAVEIELNSNLENPVPTEEDLTNREPPTAVNVEPIGFQNSKDTPDLLNAIKEAHLKL